MCSAGYSTKGPKEGTLLKLLGDDMGIAIAFMVAGGWTVLEGVPMLGQYLVEREQRIEQEERVALEQELDYKLQESGNRLIITVKTMEDVEAEENARLLELGQRERRVIKK